LHHLIDHYPKPEPALGMTGRTWNEVEAKKHNENCLR